MAVRSNGDSHHEKTVRQTVIPARVMRTGRSAVMEHKRQIADNWMQTQLPALAGSHASRPWVKYVLRTLVRAPFTVA
ncbi:hypothetical protein N007_19680 [Alicyclobacillus acidoterrestris ATCC 49025]|nr:hypothetical protein N007_19680 [Alicyclobacillus acidoterrestris ATCC 49025]